MPEPAPAELPITGYLDRFSHRPGEVFAAKVSLRTPGPADARLLRLISGDPNPAGPGLRFEDLSHRFSTSFDGHHQPIRQGSYARIGRAPRRDGATTWRVLVWIQARPTGEAAILSEEQGAHRATLLLGPGGAAAEFAWPGGSARLALDAPPPLRQWITLSLSADPASGAMTLAQDAALASTTQPGLSLPDGDGTLLIAARDAATPRAHFTGKIEAPALLDGSSAVLAAWDFALGIPTQRVTDIGPQACHGELINLPGRGMTGSRWRGAEMCWRHAPADYAAIHFHADDLADCGWETSFTFTVPEGLSSGAYAFHLTCAEGEDWVPFYVLPPRGTASAPVAFLASTFTYQAYANHARGTSDAAYRARVAEWGAYPNNPDDYPIYGRSTYNRHPDNSGIAISSRLRPILTMRPGFLTFNDARGSGLRHYPADTHLLAWMESQGIAFDVITDEDLHEEGATLLAPYKVVLTGSHPEYHTAQTLDALFAYTRAQGRLMYLGGNGFYWRIACVPEMPGIMELRRAEGGIRAWAAQPGEYYHALDGAYGGLWRRNGRPPQQLAGVGFSGQGLFEGTHYRKLPAAADHGWIFEGVEEETFGNYGLSGGGAAGFELDRADFTLGTPADAVILARSEDPPASFVTVPEELLSHVNTVSGEKADALKRAEIVYFETEGGGAVFATGSITWCGSLFPEDGPVSRIMRNVLRRFAS